MTDLLRDGVAVFLSLTLISGFARHRAERSVIREVSSTVHGGHLYCDIQPDGLLGLVLGRAKRATLWGKDNVATGLPFEITKGPGLCASLGALQVRFENLRLKNALVSDFETELPNVTVDISRVAVDQRVILKSVSQGNFKAVVSSRDLEQFIAAKYKQVTSPQVNMDKNTVTLTGEMVGPFAGKLNATGQLKLRDGKFADLVNMQITLNGKQLNAASARLLLSLVNPVIDVNKDLGLGESFYASTSTIESGKAVIIGTLRIPVKK